MKTTFSRMFCIIAGLLLLCVLFLGAGFRALMSNYLVRETRRELTANAEAVAALAAAYKTAGELEENWDFRLSLSFAAGVADSSALVCDEGGTVVVCSCESLSCAHLGFSIDAGIVAGALEEGWIYDQGDLGGIYGDERYYVAQAIASDSTDALMGLVLVSAPVTEPGEIMGPVFELFLITAGVVLLMAVAATSVLARNQAQQFKALTAVAHRFGHGDLKARAPVSERATEEMNELSAAFNNMAISLEQAEIRRREFVANISHELKTPMTTIAGFMDGMLDGTIPPARHRQYMQTVSEEVHRLSRLVRSMLEISRLQSQGIPEHIKRRFDLAESVGQVLISFERKINEKNLQVEAKLPEKGLRAWAAADAITQVLYNLTDNAVKFCPPEGRLWVRVEPAGGKARVAVGNTGPTIPEHELPLLFDRFHKTDKSRSADREGYGLGLYIVKTIIDGHGEDITVSSRDGRTEFSFTLPLVK